MDETKLHDIVAKKLQIKQLEEEVSELIDELGLRQADHGTIIEGRFIIEVSPNVRFDPAKATELFPLGENGENMELYSAKVDSTLAKKFMSEEQYKTCQKVFANNKVEVKLV
jgi:hypothetical protein